MTTYSMVNINDSMSFNQFLEVSKYSKNTIQSYMLYYNKIKDDSITQTNVNIMCRRYNHGVFRAFLRLYLHEYLNNKRIKIIKIRGRKGKRVPKFLEEHEIKQLYDAAKEKGKEDLMFVILLGYHSGFRISEILNFTLSRCNRGVVLGKGNKEAKAFIPNFLKEMIINYTVKYNIKKTDKLFNTTRFCVDTKIRRLGKKILDKPVSAHQFRHSCAVNLLRRGMPISYIKTFLRHESISTTDIYATATESDVENKWKEIIK